MKKEKPEEKPDKEQELKCRVTRQYREDFDAERLRRGIKFLDTAVFMALDEWMHKVTPANAPGTTPQSGSNFGSEVPLLSDSVTPADAPWVNALLRILHSGHVDAIQSIKYGLRAIIPTLETQVDSPVAIDIDAEGHITDKGMATIRREEERAREVLRGAESLIGVHPRPKGRGKGPRKAS